MLPVLRLTRWCQKGKVGRPFYERDFPAPPPLGAFFTKEGVMKDIVPSTLQPICYLVPDCPNYHVGHTLLQSCLLRQEFSWVPIHLMSQVSFSIVWAPWADHVFTRDLSFIKVLRQVVIANMIWVSNRLATPCHPDDIGLLMQ